MYKLARLGNRPLSLLAYMLAIFALCSILNFLIAFVSPSEMGTWTIMTGAVVSGPILIFVGSYLTFAGLVQRDKVWGRRFLIGGILWFLLFLLGLWGLHVLAHFN